MIAKSSRLAVCTAKSRHGTRRIVTALLAVAAFSGLLQTGCAPRYELASVKHTSTGNAETFSFMQFTGGQWQRADVRKLHRCKRALLLTHGVLEDINSSFPPASAAIIKKLGKYDDVYGITYDWSQPVSIIAPQYAAVLDRIPAKSIDVEGHSYGGIQMLAGVEWSHVVPLNVIVLGSPLHGTPLAERTFFSRVLLRLPDQAWNGNIARFRRMRDSGAIAALSPANNLPQSALARFFESRQYRNSRLIIVAGDDFNKMGFLSNMYMRIYGLECFFCKLDGDRIIPTLNSALQKPEFSQKNILIGKFQTAHADLKTDMAVEYFVASKLRIR